MNMIILWKDSNWILKSHFIATYKSCEWLGIDLTELHTRTSTVKGRDFQLGGEDEGDAGQKILVWTRQSLKGENTPFLAEQDASTLASPLCRLILVCTAGVYWTCLSGIRQQAF